MAAVVFAAGAGPGSGAARKLTVDRDAAMAMIDALEELGEFAPFTVMVSYAGAAEATTEGIRFAGVSRKSTLRSRSKRVMRSTASSDGTC